MGSMSKDESRWDAETVLDVYIHEYMVRKKYHLSANTFSMERNVLGRAAPFRDEAECGFLMEWWSLLTDMFPPQIGRTPFELEVKASPLESPQQFSEQQQRQKNLQPLETLLHFSEQQRQQENPADHQLVSNIDQTQDQYLAGVGIHRSGFWSRSKTDIHLDNEDTAHAKSSRLFEESTELAHQTGVDMGKLLLYDARPWYALPRHEILDHIPLSSPSSPESPAFRGTLKDLVEDSTFTSVSPRHLEGEIYNNSLVLDQWFAAGNNKSASQCLSSSQISTNPSGRTHHHRPYWPHQQLLLKEQVLAKTSGFPSSEDGKQEDPRPGISLQKRRRISPGGKSEHASKDKKPTNDVASKGSHEKDFLMRMKHLAPVHAQQTPYVFPQTQQKAIQEVNPEPLAVEAKDSEGTNKGGRSASSANAPKIPKYTQHPAAGLQPSSSTSTTVTMVEMLHVSDSLAESYVARSTEFPFEESDDLAPDIEADPSGRYVAEVDSNQTLDRNFDATEMYILIEVACLQHSASKVTCCHFSPDGNLFATGGEDNKICIWNLKGGRIERTLEKHSAALTDIRFSASSAWLATSSMDKTVQLWNVRDPTYSSLSLEGHVASVQSIDFHPTNEDFLFSCDETGDIKCWTLTQEDICTKDFKRGSNSMRQIRFQPKVAKYLAAVAENGVSIFDVESSTCLKSLSGHTTPVLSMCWGVDGKTMASVSEDTVKVWAFGDTNEGLCTHELKGSGDGNRFWSCVFHPWHPSILVLGCYQSLELWDIGQNRCVRIPAHDGLVSALTHCSATSLLASASHDSYVKLWTLKLRGDDVDMACL